MRKIYRPSVLPPTLLETGPGGKERERRLDTWKQSKTIDDVNKDFPKVWRNADVLGSLYAMHGRACAYCQSKLQAGDRGDVEHFRPKNMYWWMAYDFDNYLLSCINCNRIIKGKKFPIFPPSDAFTFSENESEKIDNEDRALIDPVADEVDEWMSIDFGTESFEKKSFRIIINPGIEENSRKRCEETIRFFKLSLGTELLTARQETIHLQLLRLRATKEGDEESIEENSLELKKSASRYKPHAFAVRKLLVEHCNCPQFIPTPEEEVEWLVDDILSLLRMAIDALQEIPNDSGEKNQRKRCAWALAVLMKDPPASNEAKIRSRIDNTGLLDEVIPLFNSI